MSKIPKFKSEEEEVKFWDEHEITEFLDEFKEVKESLFIRPIKRTASIRLEDSVVRRLRNLAHEKGLNWTTLIRMWVLEKLKQEQSAKSTH